MTNIEFSSEFDILYNNIMSNQAPGLSEYEKSVVLTIASEQIVKNYFDPQSNPKGYGFDDSEKRQVDLSSLIRTGSSQNGTIEDVTNSLTITKIDYRSSLYQLPSNILIPIQENIWMNNRQLPYQIVSITAEEYQRVMQRPYKQPLKNQVWRVTQGQSNTMIVEIIPHTNDIIDDYRMRYIKLPEPIILTDLTDWNITIRGKSQESQTDLIEEIHLDVLNRAVEIAKASYQGDLPSIVQLNQRTE